VIDAGRSKMLDSGFFENETWGALHKAWKGYVIAKNKNEHDKLERYARIIQELQDDLGLDVSSFPDVEMTALKFYAAKASKSLQTRKAENEGRSRHNDDNNARVEEERLTDNGQVDEPEILTDDNLDNDYFTDDFNAGDRFTS
jgi:hypothetical protein